LCGDVISFERVTKLRRHGEDDEGTELLDLLEQTLDFHAIKPRAILALAPRFAPRPDRFAGHAVDEVPAAALASRAMNSFHRLAERTIFATPPPFKASLDFTDRERGTVKSRDELEQAPKRVFGPSFGHVACWRPIEIV